MGKTAKPVKPASKPSRASTQAAKKALPKAGLAASLVLRTQTTSRADGSVQGAAGKPRAMLPELPPDMPHHGRWLIENMRIGIELPAIDRSDPPRPIPFHDGETKPSRRR